MMKKRDHMDYLKAFLAGGAICALVQILMEKTKLLPGRIMVLLVCLGVALGALGIYGPFIEFAGAGATVPLTGFGYTLWAGVKEAVTNEGFAENFADCDAEVDGRIVIAFFNGTDCLA